MIVHRLEWDTCTVWAVLDALKHADIGRKGELVDNQRLSEAIRDLESASSQYEELRDRETYDGTD